MSVTAPEITRTEYTGNASGAAAYISRKFGGSHEAVQRAMDNCRGEWETNLNQCLGESEESVAEKALGVWPRCFQTFVEDRFKGEERHDEHPPWERLSQTSGQGWIDDLVSQKGMWIAAALVRSPNTAWVKDYILRMDWLLDEGDGTITYKAAAALLFHKDVWVKLEAYSENPEMIVDYFRAASKKLATEAASNSKQKKWLNNIKESHDFDIKLYHNLSGYILSET